jgi:hypothetical protein
LRFLALEIFLFFFIFCRHQRPTKCIFFSSAVSVIALAAYFVVGIQANVVTARLRTLVETFGKEIDTTEGTDHHLRLEVVSQFKFFELWNYSHGTCADNRFLDVGISATNKCELDTTNRRYVQFAVNAKGKDIIMTTSYFLDNKCSQRSPAKSKKWNIGSDNQCTPDQDNKYSFKIHPTHTVPKHFIANRQGVAEIKYSDNRLCSTNNLQTLSALLWVPNGVCTAITLEDSESNYYTWGDKHHAWGKLYGEYDLTCKGPVVGNKELTQQNSCQSANVHNEWTNYHCM